MAMFYYEVIIGDQSYTKSDPLIYSSPAALEQGLIISAPFRRKQLLGIVGNNVNKPAFATKTIATLEETIRLPAESVDLLKWLLSYYPSGLGSLSRLFLPISPKPPKQKQNNIILGSAKLPPLTKEQKQALNLIGNTPAQHILLHGDTASGKTRIYIERALKSIKNGQSVIVLTPEISLTPQLYESLRAVFGGRLVLYHSGLTPAQRKRAWWRVARSNKPLVVVGTRSALFSPLKSVGLIVVDEAHEPAYKQEQTPRYLAPRVAAQLARLHQAELILGSATPLISDYYAFVNKNLLILRMQQAAVNTHSDPITSRVVDLKQRQFFTTSSLLADGVIEAVQDALKNHKQSLIYLNRRGTAKLVICQNCGWQALCPHCDIPLTYHGDTHTMRCHSCEYSSAVLVNCPICGESDLVYRSPGTKALDQELKRLFPNARISRFDTDSSKAEKLEQNYQAVKNGEVDILIGTQLLAKGLDLPLLSVLAVVNADASLNFPDFSAAERTYQLLYQVIGRVGRGHTHASVFIQTYQPDSPVIAAALQRNWQDFYDAQLLERRNFNFPPFCYLLKLTVKRQTAASAQKAASQLFDKLRLNDPGLDINGPAPAFFERVASRYNWQLIIKAKNRRRLLDAIKLLPANWTYDLDPINLL